MFTCEDRYEMLRQDILDFGPVEWFSCVIRVDLSQPFLVLLFTYLSNIGISCMKFYQGILKKFLVSL